MFGGLIGSYFIFTGSDTPNPDCSTMSMGVSLGAPPPAPLGGFVVSLQQQTEVDRNKKIVFQGDERFECTDSSGLHITMNNVSSVTGSIWLERVGSCLFIVQPHADLDQQQYRGEDLSVGSGQMDVYTRITTTWTEINKIFTATYPQMSYFRGEKSSHGTITRERVISKAQETLQTAFTGFITNRLVVCKGV